MSGFSNNSDADGLCSGSRRRHCLTISLKFGSTPTIYSNLQLQMCVDDWNQMWKFYAEINYPG